MQCAPRLGILKERVSSLPHPRLRIAAINFLNPAPLMWDFEHPPLDSALAERYHIDRMLPSECADRLAAGDADIGLVPIAALAVNPSLRILPGCTIAAKQRVRSLLLVHRASQPRRSSSRPASSVRFGPSCASCTRAPDVSSAGAGFGSTPSSNKVAIAHPFPKKIRGFAQILIHVGEKGCCG